MALLTASGDPRLGNELMMSDLKAFVGPTSPYRKLRVLPHLDHAFPWLDADMLEGFRDRFASVMCDASQKPFEENIRLTAQYVEKVKGKVVVEGAVDEIFEPDGAEKNVPTTPQQAKKFLDETGVDILVPNVGTEHRATVTEAKYRSGQAADISRAVGKILCLHGASSLKREDLHKLPSDGFVKINIFTTLTVRGGQAVARRVLSDLPNIFDEDQLRDLAARGIVGEHVLQSDSEAKGKPTGPKLSALANPPRRDAWFEAVRDRCVEFFEALNYRSFAP
jgi:fructose-bisphosphate aldolase class II